MATNSFPIHDGSGDEPDELNEHVDDPGDPDGLIAAEDQRRWQEKHSMSTPVPRTVYKPKRLWPKLLVVVLILAAAAFGSYWFGNHEASKKQDKKASANTQSKQSQNQPTQATTTETKHYDSTNYTLGFDYPKTWTVTDTTARLTVVSPATQLATATGSKTNIHVVVAIQNPLTSIAGFPSGGAVASVASDHLTYKQPSTIQRAQTYLSYLSYTTTNGLDSLYITGDNGYQQGQDVPMSDVVKGNPLISVMFESCTDATCANGKVVTLSASGWQSSSVSKDVVNLLESIVLED